MDILYKKKRTRRWPDKGTFRMAKEMADKVRIYGEEIDFPNMWREFTETVIKRHEANISKRKSA